MQFNYWQKLESGCTYHIYNRAVEPLDLFRSDSDYMLFLKLLKKYLVPYVDILAYCLMPNHFHLLGKIKSVDASSSSLKNEKTNAAKKILAGEIELDDFLSDQFRRMFSSYALQYNKQYQRQGSLFAPKVKRVGIIEDEKLIYLVTYIHRNPIHHKFTTTYHEWRFSSYVAYLSSKPTLVAKAIVLTYFEDLSNFKEIHDNFKILEMEETID